MVARDDLLGPLGKRVAHGVTMMARDAGHVFPAFRGVSKPSEKGGGYSGAGERARTSAIKLCTARPEAAETGGHGT